jgi:hypothetical protein
LELPTHKVPVSYTKKEKLIIYVVGAIVVLLLAYMGFYQYKKYRDTLVNGIKFKTQIIEVSCTGGSTKSRLYFRNMNEYKKHVNVKKSDCLLFKVGDSISVFENKTEDWYEIDPGCLHSLNP